MGGPLWPPGGCGGGQGSDRAEQTPPPAPRSPYIIGTTNQPVKMTPNHGLHLSFR